MAEKLEFTPDTDQYGNTYGVHTPTGSQIANKVNELIDEIDYLREKVFELEELCRMLKEDRQ